MKNPRTFISARPAIGFFDSGAGGLSVWSEVVKLVPEAETFYIADSANCPYGSLDAGKIIDLATSHVRTLLDAGCGMIVVACNTATAAAIDVLRANFKVPFVGLEPAIKPAAKLSKSKTVGVLATKGTLGGRHFNGTRAKWATGVSVLTGVADDFVKLVESGDVDSPAAYAIVRSRVEPLIAEGADVIVLGCTHFPFLKHLIERVANGRAVVLDSGYAAAVQTQRIWRSLPHEEDNAKPLPSDTRCWPLNKANRHFASTGDIAVLERILNRFSLLQA